VCMFVCVCVCVMCYCYSVVDGSVCSGLVEGVEHVLQEDAGDITGDLKKVHHLIVEYFT